MEHWFPSPHLTWALLAKKKGDLGRGWKWSMSCLGERMADAGVEPCVQVEHTVAKGQ